MRWCPAAAAALETKFSAESGLAKRPGRPVPSWTGTVSCRMSTRIETPIFQIFISIINIQLEFFKKANN
jgi:hypothetical protein